MLIPQSMFLLDHTYSRQIQSGIEAQKIHMKATFVNGWLFKTTINRQ